MIDNDQESLIMVKNGVHNETNILKMLKKSRSVMVSKWLMIYDGS